MEETTCSVCYETECLTEYISQTKSGKEIKLKFCPKHLKLAGFNLEIVTSEEIGNPGMCCGRPVNTNGHCRVCGDKY